MAEYKSPINPKKRGKRRAMWNDYTKPRIYMITMAKTPEIPPFSRLFFRQLHVSSFPKAEIDPAQVYCNYTPIGHLISDQMAKFNREHTEAQIGNRIIMSDHIHFIFHVKQRLRDKSEFGRLIAQFKGLCTRAYADYLSSKTDPTLPQITPLFEKGFNDLICFRRGQLDKFINYIKDNPRRLTIKLMKPDLFTSLMRVKIGEEYYKVIGNLFLLQSPLLEQVRFSSKFRAEEWERRKRYLNMVIERGGTVVSPFIHPEESRLFEEAKDGNAGIIYIRNRDYGEKDKPEGRLFDLCAEGRLLIIAVGKEGQRKDVISKEIAMGMNELARTIANHEGKFFLKRMT